MTVDIKIHILDAAPDDYVSSSELMRLCGIDWETPRWEVKEWSQAVQKLVAAGEIETTEWGAGTGCVVTGFRRKQHSPQECWL